MATPAWVATTPTEVSTWATSHPISLGTYGAGNHLVLSFCSNGSGGTITGPAGWTEVLSVDLNWAQKWRVWIREMTGSEGSTVTVTTSNSNRSASQVLRFRNVRAGVVEGTTWDVAEIGANGYGTTIDPPSVTATWGATDNVFVALMWAGSNGHTVSAYPTGYSNGAQAEVGVSASSATKSSSSASDDPATFTISASNNYRAATLVLRGAADASAGAITATGTGTANDATTLPPNVRAQAQTATGTGQAYPARIKTAQVDADIVIEWDLDNDGDYDQAVEDITGDVLSGWVRRGRDYPSQITGRSRAGQAQFLLNNSDDQYNYWNASSPLNAAPFSLKTGRRLRIRTTEATLDDPVQLARDRFATNGALTTDELANTWTTPSGFSGFNVAGKRAEADGVSSSTGALFAQTIDVNATTYYAQAVIPYKDAVNRLGLIFHHTDASNYGYLYVGDGVILIVEVVAGVHTTLTNDGVENRDDMAIGLAVNGTTLKAYVDGVEVLSTTTTLTPTDKVGLYARWYYQRAPLFSEFAVWDRALRTQSWDTTPAGVLATLRVTKVVPSVDNQGVKTAVLTASGDLSLLDREVEPPASTGPDPVQSFGSKAGQLIGNILHKAGGLHPPAALDGGDITLGAVGFDRQQAISMARALEATEAGFLYEPATGGVAFESRSARDATTVSATFTDDPNVAGRKIERITHRDWQGDVINDVTSEVSGRLARYDYDSSNNAFQASGVANDVTFNLPTAGDGLVAGDLLIVAIAKTVWTTGVRWITPPGWTPLRDPGDEIGKTAVFARKATASDINASVTFYDDTEPNGGTWVAMVFIVHNWLGSIAAGVAITEATGYGATSLAQAQAGQVDLPVAFTPWGAKPTLFIALRVGTHTEGSAATVSTGTDDLAPPGFDSLGSIHYNVTGFGQEVFQVGLQWCRRIRSQAVMSTTGFGGTFSGFSYLEALVIMVRGGFDDQDPPATGGVKVHDANAADQRDRGGAVLAHPDPGRFFEDVDAARTYNDHILSRYGADRPIVSIGFTATSDQLHRATAAALDLSDRIRIDADGRSGMGVDAEFFVETITHTFSNGTKVWAIDVDASPATDAGTGAD